MERRNYSDRASTVRRVLLWIQSERTPVTSLPSHLATPEAGTRILKQLAIRGLIQITDDGWIARPLLLNPSPLLAADN